MSKDDATETNRRSFLKKSAATATMVVGGTAVASTAATADSERKLVVEAESGRGSYSIIVPDADVETQDFEWYDDDVDRHYHNDTATVSGQVANGFSGSNQDEYLYNGPDEVTVQEIDSNVNYYIVDR
ncbi:twin-arginine translocation signal domain-containing protein [Halomontanus rarus]|uniref:twin-arginine translocation signal domain-containing protein n=1 Tax=Halomontanus rarus TaxID=3034020 RepID=UPI001A98BD48